MKFFNRFAVSLLASVLCASTLFAMPVDAKKTTKRRQPTQAELAAAAALQAAIDERYNKEIESNSWENWPAGPQVYAESAIVMEASTGTILYSKAIDEQHYPASITKIMTVLPTVTDDEEVIRIVDAVIDYIKSTGLSYYVGPCETSIEGDYDQLMEIVKNCQLVAAKAGCPAMHTYVKISYKPEGEVLTIDKKVTKHHQE